MQFDRLSLLDGTKKSWKIRVRVSRMWLSRGNNGDTIQGCNLILLDEENYQVHAFIKAELWNNLANVIIEGNIYDVSHFFTKVASGRLRPVHSNMCIMFTNQTTVENVFEDDIIIPLQKFDFSDLGDLENLVNSYCEDQNPLYAIDVIGVVQDVQQPKVIQTVHGGEKRLVRLTITDGRFSYKVNVWDEHTAAVDMLFEVGLQTPTIIILSSLRLCKFRGIVEITTLPFSKIIINGQNEHVLLYRQRLEQEGFEAQDDLA